MALSRGMVGSNSLTSAATSSDLSKQNALHLQVKRPKFFVAEEIEVDIKDFNGRFFLEVLKSRNWRGFEGLIGCLIIAISGESPVFLRIRFRAVTQYFSDSGVVTCQ